MKEYQPLIKKEKFDLKCLSYLLPYLAIQINTSYQNNIKEHYGKHLLRFINKTTTEDKEIKNKIKKTVFRTRDSNSAINIKNLFRYYCKYRKRPKEFIRSSSLYKQSKVEQSVDFTEDNASN